MFLLLVSNSTQDPLDGISFAVASGLPEIGSVFILKYTPGDLTN